MAFTPSDIDTIDRAMVALAAGTRKGQVQIGDQVLKFADTTMADLQKLREIVVSVVGSSAAGTVPLRTYASNGGRG